MAYSSSRFQYRSARDKAMEEVLPYLPFQLRNQTQAIMVTGLVDSGASVNVLPYSIGLQLGAVWEQQRVELELSGNLAAVEARGLLLTATVDSFPPVRLAFAWAYSDDIPLILG